MYNRIQKLLLTEYKDFSETVFIESSFAEVDSKGIGIRQIQLGLTDTKLIIATDKIPLANVSLIQCSNHADPEIESFELVSLIPLEFCHFKLCARYQRNFISVTIANGRKVFFEFGEYLMRSFFYNIWADRIFYMNKTKYISYSTTTLESTGKDENDESVELIHQNSNFEVDQSSIFSFVKSRTKLPKEKNRVENQEVHKLKRRIHKLNHNIKRQLEVMMNGETVDEATHLLVENKQEIAKIHNSCDNKAIIDIYKKSSQKESINSIENIWF